MYSLERNPSPPLYRSPITNLSIESDHYLQAAQSRFVLCPSGLGFDTYRLWETLLLGAIPIVEVLYFT